METTTEKKGPFDLTFEEMREEHTEHPSDLIEKGKLYDETLEALKKAKNLLYAYELEGTSVYGIIEEVIKKQPLKTPQDENQNEPAATN